MLLSVPVSVTRPCLPQSAIRVSHGQIRIPGSSLSYSQALPGKHFPAFKRYYEGAKTSCLPSQPARFTRRPIPPLTLYFRSQRCQSHRRYAWALVSRLAHLPAYFGGEDRISHVRREPPLCLCRALRPRPGVRARPFTARPYCPRAPENEGPDDLVTFRGSITRLWHSLSTLHAAFTDDDARLASGWQPTFTGWGCRPTGFLQSVSVVI